MAERSSEEAPAPAVPRIASQPEFVPASDGRYALADLTRFHDARFVDAAYRALLGRAPDQTGLQHHLDLLRSGRLSKVEILGRLRASDEGRRHGSRVRGLGLRFALCQLARLPLLGYPIALLAELLRLPARARMARELEAHLLQRSEAAADHLDGLGERVEAIHALQARMAGQLEDQLGRMDTELRTLASEKIEQQRAREVVGDRLARLADEMRAAQQANEVRLEQVAEHAEALDALRAANDALTARADAEMAARENLGGLLHSQVGGALVRLDALTDLVRLLESRLEGDLRTSLEHCEESLREQGEAISAVEAWSGDEMAAREAVGAEREATRAQLQRAQRSLDGMKVQSSHQELRVQRLLEEARRRLPAPLDAEQLGVFAHERDHALDALYLNFESDFRGSIDEVKEKQRIYLPVIEAAGLGGPDRPVVDLGCGRGEWLELCREQGLHARGVDDNRKVLERAQSLGLDVKAGDALDFLAELPEASVGVVTGFHIVEHLALEVLVRLLDESVRVLAPGGLAIFETPNPANIQVASHGFYMDPTHRNPLPARVMEFLAEARGLCDVRVMLLNPDEEALHVPGGDESELVRRFNALFHGPRDYAVVGRKP